MEKTVQEKINERYAHVQDDECKQNMIRLAEIGEEQKILSDKIKVERQSMQEKRVAERDADLKVVDDKRDKIRKQIDAIYSQISISPEQQLENLKITTLRTERMKIVHGRDPLNRERRNNQERMEDLTNKAKVLRLEIESAIAAAPNRSKADVEAEVKLCQEKLETAQKSKVPANVAKAMRDLKASQVQLDALNKVAQLQDEFSAKVNDVEALSKKIQQTDEQLETTEARLKELNTILEIDEDASEAQREAEKKKRDARIEKEKAERDGKRKEIDDLKEILKKIKEERDEISNKFAELIPEGHELAVKKKQLDDERATLKAGITSAELTIDEVQYVSEIIGKGGATLRQVQEDFGVMIDINRDSKPTVVTIQGTNASECKESLEDIITNAKVNRVTEEVQIDLDCIGEFIGEKGAQIQAFQARSGAVMDLEKETGKVTVIGNKECVDLALEILKEFKQASYTVSFKVATKYDTFMRPNLMREWQADLKCRRISYSKKDGALTIRGLQENVDKAKEYIQSFLNTTAEVLIPSSANIPGIIGKGGSTINEMKNVTGCLLDIDEKGTRVLIAGDSEDKVKNAVAVVEAKISENIQEEVTIPYNKKYHTYLTRRQTPKTQHTDPNKEEETQEENPDSPTSPESPSQRSLRKLDPDASRLEVLRHKHNCFTARADPETSKITIRGPKDSVQLLEREIKSLLSFEGKHKEAVKLNYDIFKYLTTNTVPKAEQKVQRGRGPPKTVVKMRIDPVRDIEGVDDIFFDPRGERTIIEIIATEEGLKAAKERIASLNAAGKNRSCQLEIGSRDVPTLIGTGGRNLRELEEELRVLIVIPQRNARDESGSVSVTVFAAAPPPAGVPLQEHLQKMCKEITDNITSKKDDIL